MSMGDESSVTNKQKNLEVGHVKILSHLEGICCIKLHRFDTIEG